MNWGPISRQTRTTLLTVFSINTSHYINAIQSLFFPRWILMFHDFFVGYVRVKHCKTVLKLKFGMFHTHTTWQDPNVMTSLSCPWTSAKLLTMSCFCWRNWNTMGSKHHGKTHGQIQETPCETPWTKKPRKPMDKNNNTLIVNELFDRCDSPNCFFGSQRIVGERLRSKVARPANQQTYKTSTRRVPTNISLTSAKARNHTIMYITGKLHHIHFPTRKLKMQMCFEFWIHLNKNQHVHFQTPSVVTLGSRCPPSLFLREKRDSHQDAMASPASVRCLANFQISTHFNDYLLLMVDDYLWLMVRKYLSGWWLTYPSEKWWS